MTGLEILITFIVIALVGWGICELKYKSLPFHHTSEEQAGWDEFKEHAEMNDGKEMNIRDIVRTNSTKGYDAVGSENAE